jgi:transcriptional regulator with XRE-family HTH domain
MPRYIVTTDVLQRRQIAGRILKQLRQRAGLTQQQLATKVGLKYLSFVSQLETGESALPAERIPALAEHLAIDVRALGLLMAFGRRSEGYWRTLTGRPRPENLSLADLLDAHRRLMAERRKAYI